MGFLLFSCFICFAFFFSLFFIFLFTVAAMSFKDFLWLLLSFLFFNKIFLDITIVTISDVA